MLVLTATTDGGIMDRGAFGALAPAGLAVLLTTGCGQPAGAFSVPTATGVAVPSGATTQPGTTRPGTTQQAATPSARPEETPRDQGAPVQPKIIPLGTNSAVEALLKTNEYLAPQGVVITFDASLSSGRIDTYEWDLDGDGSYDATTSGPVFKHTYTSEFDGEVLLRVSNLAGSSDVVSHHVHASTTKYSRPLAPPENVQVEVLSTVNRISVIKVTWESDDPAADSWAVTLNGFPAGRVEGSARTAIVTDVHREEDVAVDVLGLTPDMALGLRGGTILPAVE
jgi:hypothetical protein